MIFPLFIAVAVFFNYFFAPLRNIFIGYAMRTGTFLSSYTTDVNLLPTGPTAYILNSPTVELTFLCVESTASLCKLYSK